MNIERALATDGWMSGTELLYLASVAEKSHMIAEVGSWRGRSARAMADNTPGVVHCFDTWADNAYGTVFPGDAPDLCDHPDWLWNEFQENHADTVGTVVFCHRMSSVEGANYARNAGLRFDAIFIDAGHQYVDVVADITAWMPLLKKGGILFGHDYHNIHHPEVVKALDELVPKYSVVDTIWTTEEL
jgi:predicted O-methyltransferase YrrM